MSGRTTARIAARYSASARGVSEADLQHMNCFFVEHPPFLESITTQQKFSFRSTRTTSLTTFTKIRVLPGNVSIGANAWTSTSFLRSSGAWKEVAPVVPVDGDVHHLESEGLQEDWLMSQLNIMMKRSNNRFQP